MYIKLYNISTLNVDDGLFLKQKMITSLTVETSRDSLSVQLGSIVLAVGVRGEWLFECVCVGGILCLKSIS